MAQLVSFIIEGEYYTDLLRQCLREGTFKTVLSILREGGLPETEVKEFFLLKRKFEGTTEGKGELDFVSCDFPEMNETFSEFYFFALKTAVNEEDYDAGIDIRYFEEQIEAGRNFPGKEKYEALREVFSVEEIIDIIFEFAIEYEGYEIAKNGFIGKKNIDGVILKDGTLVLCESQQHINLYPVLYSYYKSTSSRWTDEESTIHITSSQLSGKCAYELAHPGLYDLEITDAMIDTLFLYKDWIREEYGSSSKRTAKILLSYISDTTEKGGKFNNLTFLKRFYKDINLPQFSLTQIDGVRNCIRTSPKHSLAGLLNSKFDITESSLDEISADWEKFKNIIPNNELHIFYQEFIEGGNGVFHYFGKDDFDYKYSDNQGDIVKGVNSLTTVSLEVYRELRKIGRMFYSDFDAPVQCEFVVKDEIVYIVQLRLLTNNYEKTVIIRPSDDERTKVAFGLTFSRGTLESVHRDEILIVDDECSSEDLIGKKALIVKNNTNFSHALALSKSLRIPSIYATGEVNLPEIVKFVAYNKEAWIIDATK